MPVLDRLQERLLTLCAAVEGNDWEVANRLMLELGLYLQVDFRPMSAVERRESVQVLVDPTTMKRGSGGTDYVGYDTPTFIPGKSSKSRPCSSTTRGAVNAPSFANARDVCSPEAQGNNGTMSCRNALNASLSASTRPGMSCSSPSSPTCKYRARLISMAKPGLA